jgi:hypothetical protein
MKPLSIVLLFFATGSLNAQQRSGNDAVETSFKMRREPISDSSGLILTVVFHNINNKAVPVYTVLAQGAVGDRFANIKIELQQLVNGKYIPRELGTEHLPRPDEETRHFDLPKKPLPPGKRDTLQMGLLETAQMLYKGSYRIKAHLRVRTIKDTTVYDFEKDAARPFPDDVIKYTTSQWIYFTTTRDILRRPVDEKGIPR